MRYSNSKCYMHNYHTAWATCIKCQRPICFFDRNVVRIIENNEKAVYLNFCKECKTKDSSSFELEENCYYHPDRLAWSYCEHCNQSVCIEDHNENVKSNGEIEIVCVSCLNQNNNDYSQEDNDEDENRFAEDPYCSYHPKKITGVRCHYCKMLICDEDNVEELYSDVDYDCCELCYYKQRINKNERYIAPPTLRNIYIISISISVGFVLVVLFSLGIYRIEGLVYQISIIGIILLVLLYLINEGKNYKTVSRKFKEEISVYLDEIDQIKN